MLVLVACAVAASDHDSASASTVRHCMAGLRVGRGIPGAEGRGPMVTRDARATARNGGGPQDSTLRRVRAAPSRGPCGREPTIASVAPDPALVSAPGRLEP